MLEKNDLVIAQLQKEFTLDNAVENWMELRLEKYYLKEIEEKTSKDPFFDSSDDYKKIDARLKGNANEMFEKYSFYKKAIRAGCKTREEEDAFYDEHLEQVVIDKGEEYVAREELVNLANKLGERPRFLFPDEIENNIAPEAIDSRKEKTLYCLIAVLAEKSGYSPDSPDTVGKIAKHLEMEGIKMDKKTIRTHIKEAFKSLNERRE